VHYGSTLLRIESVKESIYREGGHLHSVGGYADKSSGREPPRLRYRESSLTVTCDNARILILR
jgi:hypothetical protein